MSSFTAPREHLLRALHADLVGPYALDENNAPSEVLELPPSRTYLTGFLCPEEKRSPEDTTADEDLGAGPDEPEEENPSGAEVREEARPNLLPASMGLSVLLPKEAKSVQAIVRFAEYHAETVKPENGGRGQRVWKRNPRQTIPVPVPLDPATLENGITLPNTVGIRLIGQIKPVEHARGIPEGTRALALFVVNRRGQGDRGRRDEEMIFQVELEVECAEGIFPRPNVADEGSEQWDANIADLQFRDRVEYAVGHGVAIAQPEQIPGKPVTAVKTTWIPEYEVRRVVPRDEAGVTVAMDDLGHLETAEDVRAKLERLPAAYHEWITKQRATEVGGESRVQTRDALMDKASEAGQRIRDGIKL
ncbi:MAG TPA: hypothetical protein PK156_44935, partial [Polyangium sp.]|nr:hypothetical protein [Polyangium sp.]